jgi:hypothetical protein
VLFILQVWAHGVRAYWSNSTRPSSAFTVFLSPPNGSRQGQVGGLGFGLETEKNLKPEKCSKNAQNPTCPLHALLGNLYERKTHHQ